MPKEKSLRLDGMTMEVLDACWSFLGNDLRKLICHFWNIGALLHRFTIGVMKVIPKKATKWRLHDWRPLTISTIIYKLIATILSIRLNPANKDLISP